MKNYFKLYKSHSSPSVIVDDGHTFKLWGSL